MKMEQVWLLWAVSRAEFGLHHQRAAALMILFAFFPLSLSLWQIHGRTHLWRSSGTQGRWVSLDNPLGAQEGVGDVPQGCVGALGEHRPRRVRGRAQLRAGPAGQGGLGGPEQGPAPAHGWGSPLNPPHNLQGGHNPGWQHP